MKQQIIVTGANGYIGNNVVSYLASRHGEAEIFAIDRSQGAHPDGVNSIALNIFSKEEINAFFHSIDEDVERVVIHLAWQDGFSHNADSHLANLPLHIAFLEHVLKIPHVSLSVMGSMHEVGYWNGVINADTPCNPLSCYGIAKNTLRQWLLLKAKDSDASVKWLRAYYIYGDDLRNHSVFTKILEWEAQGKETFAFTTGRNQYDFISIGRLAEQIAEASLQRRHVGIINCCSGVPVALRDMVMQFILERGLRIRPEYGAFPDRPYDSPCVYGDSKEIEAILMERA